jgi:hypothetical protein
LQCCWKQLSASGTLLQIGFSGQAATALAAQGALLPPWLRWLSRPFAAAWHEGHVAVSLGWAGMSTCCILFTGVSSLAVQQQPGQNPLQLLHVGCCWVCMCSVQRVGKFKTSCVVLRWELAMFWLQWLALSSSIPPTLDT